MIKRKLFSAALAAVICCGFSACDEVEYTENTSKYGFNSAEEVENMSDEELLLIYENGYSIDEFYSEGTYEKVSTFDVPLEERSVTFTALVSTSDISSEINLKKALPSDEVNEYAEFDIREFADEDDEIMCVGENDYYIVYRQLSYGEYTVENEDDNAVTEKLLNERRTAYFKTFIVDHESDSLLLLGKLNKKYVVQQMDLLLMNNVNNRIIYREIEENKSSYIYSIYYFLYSGGDWGLDSSVSICKNIYTIDKKTHSVEVTYEDIMETRIPGTALSLDWLKDKE
ncbi:MAG: hypothetical protein IJC04_11965 [Oscillospiraceae bacterium]|nr:hypothetical protein [Oscillospiraceae bacterium]